MTEPFRMGVLLERYLIESQCSYRLGKLIRGVMCIGDGDSSSLHLGDRPSICEAQSRIRLLD